MDGRLFRLSEIFLDKAGKFAAKQREIGASPIVYRLCPVVDHCALADGRVPVDPLCLSSEHWLTHVWRLLIGTIVMLAFGYMGEAGIMNVWTVLPLSAWMAGSSSCLYLSWRSRQGCG